MLSVFRIFISGAGIFVLNVGIVCVWQMQQANTREQLELKVGLPDNLRGSLEQNDKLQAKEYIMWSGNEEYQPYCRQHFLGNASWGKELAPLVDKIKVKEILNEWNIPDVKIVPTLTTYNKSNMATFSYEDMKQLPDPSIIKGAHLSGQVASVRNGVFHCFKQCPHEHRHRMRVGNESSLDSISFLFNHMLDTSFSAGVQTQYDFVEHRIIVEEHLDMSQFRDVTYWYVANGVPIFVSMECDEPDDPVPHRNFYTEDFQMLNAKLLRSACSVPIPKPATWDKMRSIVRNFGKFLPRSIVRIDLYASETDVYFSEFTFTTNGCKGSFTPSIVGGLLSAVYEGKVDANAVTPNYVKQTIEGTSWSFAPFAGLTPILNETRSYPSPLELCNSAYHGLKLKEQRARCINTTKTVQTYPFRCITTSSEGKHISAIGSEKYPTIASFMDRLEMDKVMILAIVVAYLTYYGIGTKERPNQYRNNFIFWCLMLLYMYLFTKNEGLLSRNHSVLDVVTESFRTFKAVHPMSSPLVCLSHFATYWFPIAAWRSKSLHNLVMWMFCYELISTLTDEFTHHLESMDRIKCLRLSFIHEVQSYAIDGFLWKHALQFFFVYLYLLPSFLWHWTNVLFGLVVRIALWWLG